MGANVKLLFRPVLLSVFFAIGFRIVAVLAEYCAVDDADEVPILWEDDHCEKRCVKLWTSIPGFKALDFNDKASSLIVPAGWSVYLYKDTNYEGNYLFRKGPIRIDDLKRDRPDGRNWGDCISSAEVIPPPDY